MAKTVLLAGARASLRDALAVHRRREPGPAATTAPDAREPARPGWRVLVGRARTPIVVIILVGLSVGIFALPGVAVVALTGNSSAAGLLVHHPALTAGMGLGTLLGLTVLFLILLMGLARRAGVKAEPPEPVAPAAATAGPPAGI